jgi:predicted sulfurtransferase
MAHAVLFYRYADIAQIAAAAAAGGGGGGGEGGRADAADPVDGFVARQRALCARLGLLGRLLIGAEGLNGALCCPGCGCGAGAPALPALPAGCPLARYAAETAAIHPTLAGIDWKVSSAPSAAAFFDALAVKRVREIVATNRASVRTDPATGAIVGGGTHLSPDEWHAALLATRQPGAKDTVVIDVRNTFEHAIGTFYDASGRAAIEPGMRAFTQFERWCDDTGVQTGLRDKKVLMFCTGGIRCEKASAILRSRGVKDVSQLRGGIHRYLEAYPADRGGFFRGKNFVFDHRVTTPASSSMSSSSGAAAAAAAAATVVGACVECACPHDELRGTSICAVCRDFVVVCPTCVGRRREYHCRAHQPLKDCFFALMDGFALEEIEAQAAALRAHVKAASAQLQQNVTAAIPLVTFNDKKILHRQVLRLEARARDLREGVATINERWSSQEGGWVQRCRSCGEHESDCTARKTGGRLTRCASKLNRKIVPRTRATGKGRSDGRSQRARKRGKTKAAALSATDTAAAK